MAALRIQWESGRLRWTDDGEATLANKTWWRGADARHVIVNLGGLCSTHTCNAANKPPDCAALPPVPCDSTGPRPRYYIYDPRGLLDGIKVSQIQPQSWLILYVISPHIQGRNALLVEARVSTLAQHLEPRLRDTLIRTPLILSQCRPMSLSVSLASPSHSRKVPQSSTAMAKSKSRTT